MVRALVLSGGGDKCAYQAGAIKYLTKDLKRDYEVICGVSGGALNAARMAQFPLGTGDEAADCLIHDWSSVRKKDIYKPWFPFGKLQALCNSSFYNSAPLWGYVEERVDPELIKVGGRRCVVGAVCLDTYEYVRFDERDPDFLKGVLASASYPLAFLPVKINGRYYSDGGLRNGSPIGAAISEGADTIDVIITSPERTEPEPVHTLTMLDVAMRSLEILSDEVFQTDIAQALYVNRLIRAGAAMEDKVLVEINVLRPKRPLNTDSLAFDQENIQYMIRAGWEDMREGGMVTLGLQ